MSDRTAAIIVLIIGLIKNNIILMSEYFPAPKSSGGRVQVEWALSNYATKADLNKAMFWYFKICWKEWFSKFKM